MDVPQLKLLAGLIRGLLEQHNVSVGHSQSLDLVAALPGLRNWPEVMSFPDRVAACVLDSVSTSRLAFRLRTKHNLEFNPEGLVDVLSPPEMANIQSDRAPQIWPSGPRPGVYVTTSQTAINNLLPKYEEATDGEVVYAEGAGLSWDGGIDLGEYGLSSNGLSRVPSGTLLVVGPLEFNQQSWEASANKLDWACIRAQSSGHRVAVLIKTPTPDLMFKDIEVMVRSASPEGDDRHQALVGIVSEAGELIQRMPFVQDMVAPVVPVQSSPMDPLPEPLIGALKKALSRRKTGFLTIGSSLLQDHMAIEQLAAVLTLTPDIGPVARIKLRNRSTPAKDMMVPDAIRALPIMPSVESAYAHGYRRMIVEARSIDTETMLKYSHEVLFLTGAHGLDAANAFMDSIAGGGFNKPNMMLEKLVAAASVSEIEVKGGIVRFGDFFAPGDFLPPSDLDFDEALEFVTANRSVRWETELKRLLDNRLVSAAAVKKSLKRQREIDEFFAALMVKLR